MKLRHSLNQSDTKAIHAHLLQCDGQFVPPLSARVDLISYAQKLAANAQRHEVWLADDLIALIAIYANAPDKSCAFVSNVSVRSDQQGKGLARQKMEEAIAQLREMGFAKLALEVHIDNDPAQRLYAALGFTRTAQRGDQLELSLEIKEKA